MQNKIAQRTLMVSLITQTYNKQKSVTTCNIVTLSFTFIHLSHQCSDLFFIVATSSSASGSDLNSVIPFEIKMLYQAINFLISATYTRSRSKLGNTSA